MQALVLCSITLAALVIYLLICLIEHVQQRRCKHERIWEDRSCTAHCKDCGKNLGFIGTWREKQRQTSGE